MRARFLIPALLLAWLPSPWMAVAQTASVPVSFSREIAPLFRRSCNGCHRPGKEKGGLDLTSHAALVKGGKHGDVLSLAKLESSRLLEEITGPEPSMPKEGDPLNANEVALVARWLREGGRDDTVAIAGTPKAPPVYAAPPLITALGYSPDGKFLAVGGFHEVVLLNATNFQAETHLLGEGARIESFEFSPDGKLLAVAAGSPGVFGEVQIWDVAGAKQLHAYKVAYDSIFGIHWSPEGTRVAYGCADKTARILRVEDGKELVKFDQHSDWVFGAVFVNNGKQLVSGSRDRSLKLVDATSGVLIDVVNRDTEPIQCLAKHPLEDWVIFGSEVRPRMYKALAKPDNINPDRDPNFIREFENFESGVTAVTFSPDGKMLAATGSPAGEVRVHAVANAQRKAVLRGHEGVVFGLSFSPDGTRLATAGYEGVIRVFDWSKEKLMTNFVPVKVVPPPRVTRAGK